MEHNAYLVVVFAIPNIPFDVVTISAVVSLEAEVIIIVHEIPSG